MSSGSGSPDEDAFDRLRYEALVESHGDLISRFLPDGTLTFVSRRYCEFFGKRAEQLIGRSIFDDVPASERALVRERLARLSAGNPTIRGTNPIESVSGEPRLVDWVNTAIVGADGAVREIQSVGRDITEQRRIEAELERSNEEFAQFAYVAAHDLKAPLRNLLQMPGLLGGRYGERLDETGRRLLEMMAERLGRMDGLIEGLLTYANVGAAPEIEPVDLNRVLASVLDNLELSIAEAGGEVTAAPLPVVAATEMDCLRLLQNLLANALKFRGDAPPKIEIAATSEDGRALVSVSDNGIGIDARHFDDIFRPLRRLHDDSRFTGAGLGLATCQKICRRLGGDIAVDSTPGRGSVFRVTLPLAERA